MNKFSYPTDTVIYVRGSVLHCVKSRTRLKARSVNFSFLSKKMRAHTKKCIAAVDNAANARVRCLRVESAENETNLRETKRALRATIQFRTN